MTSKLLKPEMMLIIHALRFLISQKKKEWKRLDSLYSERFYLEGHLARMMHQSGDISVSVRDKIWADLDERCGEYDDRCLDRWLIKNFIYDVVNKLQKITREETNEKGFIAYRP